MSKQKFQQLKAISDKKDLTPLQNLVLMLHAANSAAGLECIVQNTVYVLPTDWHKHQQGVYTFIYKNKEGKRIQFKFVDNEDGALNVNFVVEGSDKLNQISLKVSDGPEKNIQKYEALLKQVLVGKTETKSSFPTMVTLEPVPIQPISSPLIVPNRPAVINPMGGAPFPGGGIFNPNGELVGPDSYIFRGYGGTGGTQGGFGDGSNPRVPFGARYDPVNPFDRAGQPQGPFSGQPFGFDQFGRPITRPPPNPFSGSGFGGLGPSGRRF